MSYTQATINKRANVYHDGKVTSRSIVTADGKEKTLGIMLPGSYNFGTGAPEIMEITAGRCRVRLAGEADWQEYATGESFNVPGDSRFDIEAIELLDYVCHFG